MSVEDQWAISIPELRNRPAAVEAMRADSILRRNFERMHHDFMGVALRIKDHRTASEILGLLWRSRIEEFTKIWDPKLDHAVFGELHGALRNIYLNAVTRATGREQNLRPRDVTRRPQDPFPSAVAMELYANVEPGVAMSAMLAAFEFVMSNDWQPWEVWSGEEILAANAIMMSEGRECEDQDELVEDVADEAYAKTFAHEYHRVDFFELNADERRRVRENKLVLSLDYDKWITAEERELEGP